MTVDDIVDGLEQPKQDAETAPYDYRQDYWLAFPYFSTEFSAEVIKRFGDHLERWQTTNIGNAIWTAYRAYHLLESRAYGANADPIVSITEAGEDGEFMAMRMNQFRGLIKHQIALVTANRATWDPQARTNDARATQQCTLTRALLDYVMDEKMVWRKLKTQYEIAKVTAAGFIAMGWKETFNGNGTIWAYSLAPWEICHERVRDYETMQWCIFRTYENRYDWVARFAKDDPEKARKIAGLQSEPHLASAFMFDDPEGGGKGDKTDRFEALHIYVKPSESCPDGRYAIIADDEVVLLDGPNPFGDEIPVSRLCPAEFVGTSVPFGDSWSLLAPDEAYNAMLSMCMTRVEAFGVPSLGVPAGSEWTREDFSGLKMLDMPPTGQKPEAIDLLEIPAALPEMMNLVKTGMEELSGINSVTRGAPSENVSSGSYAALLQQMAIQFNSADEEAWIANLERVGSLVLRIYQRMADEKQLISICGTDETWTAQEFTSEDLDQVMRVGVKAGNALSKTIAGRMAMADNLLERQAIKTPEEYLEVMNTGNVTPLFSSPTKERNLIKAENEALMSGDPQKMPKCAVWDNDQLHIREHRALLDTQLRSTPLAQGVMAHLQEHMTNWQNKTLQAPDILAAIGQPPLPAAQAAQQQAQQMQGGAPGPEQPGPRQQPQPETDAPKGKPGPQPGPRGQEPGPMPNQPNPSKTPAGEPVV